MNPIAPWLLAIRPKTLTAIIAPVLMAAALAGDQFHLGRWLLCLLFGLLIQVGTNLANDYFDHMKGSDTKKRKGPVRVCQADLIEPLAVRLVSFSVFALAFLTSLILSISVGPWALILGSVSVFLGLAYTAGPYALAYLGLGDLFVLIFFGPIALGGTHAIVTGSFVPVVWALGLAPGFLSTALLVVNNIRDIDEDRQAGKRTLAVRFGKTFSLFEYATCMIAAFLIPLMLTGGPLSILFVAPLGVWLLYRMMRAQDYNKTLGLNGVLLGLYALTFFIGMKWS